MRNYAKPGERHNRLVLIKLHEKRAGAYTWIARCDCGATTIVSVRDFRSGHTKSCGCLRREVSRAMNLKHGMAETAEFRIWCHMNGRCSRPSNAKYAYYGGRGIGICERWSDFENFYADMGKRQSPVHSIDRIDNNGDYAPDNCRWATPKQQAQNKSNNVYVSVSDQRVAVREAERLLDIGAGSIIQRVRKIGGTHQDAADHFAARAAMLGGGGQ